MPRKAAGIVRLSNELLRTGSGADAYVRQTLSEDLALVQDAAFLNGEPGSVQPMGILKYALSAAETPTTDKVTLHVASVTGGTGDTFMPADVALMISLLEESPDPQGPTSWIMRPSQLARIANARADAVTSNDHAGPFLFVVPRANMAADIGRQLAGYPVVTSTNLPPRSKGGVSTLTSIILGNFNRAVIGRSGAIEMLMSEHAYFSTDEVAIRAIARVDFALLRPESFVLCDTVV
jgi:HK97 family phage major capsid protein